VVLVVPAEIAERDVRAYMHVAKSRSVTRNLAHDDDDDDRAGLLRL
jgi:hypothetical protein